MKSPEMFGGFIFLSYLCSVNPTIRQSGSAFGSGLQITYDALLQIQRKRVLSLA